MFKIRIYDGHLPETPLFHVYLRALRGKNAVKISVQAEPLKREPYSQHLAACDVAINKALNHEKAPESAFVAVYLDNPTPNVSSKYGAPMGRQSDNMDYDAPHWKASKVKLSEGYDKGGAYWGNGQTVYAVQDGVGNVAFTRADNAAAAIAAVKES